MAPRTSETNKRISTKMRSPMFEKIEKAEPDSNTVYPVHLLFDEVNQEAAKEVCTWIINANFAKEPPTILNLIINSPGGDLNSAYAIIDLMQSSQIPIRTIGLGQIQSAGIMIFMAGTKGERVLTPNTSIMSHQYSWGVEGKHNELVAIRKEFDLTYERMMNHYKTHTSLSEAKIKKYLLPSEDVYLTAKEALKLGICDKVALM